MSATHIRAEYDHLEGLAQRFAERMSAADDYLRQMYLHLEDLRAGGWIGQGANNFYAEMDELVLPAMTRLVEVLEASSQTVSTIRAALQQAEDDAASLFGGAGETNLPKSPYPLINPLAVAKTFYDLVDSLDNFLRTPVEMLSDNIARTWVNLTAGNADDYTKLLQQYRLQDTRGWKAAYTVGGGVLGGLLDYGVEVLSGEKQWNDFGNLGVEVTSGVIQAGIGLIPVVGPVVVIGDAVVQTTGTVLEIGGTLFGQITGTDTSGFVNTIHDAREFVSLDRVVDGAVEWAGDQVGDFFEGVGDFFGF